MSLSSDEKFFCKLGGAWAAIIGAFSVVNLAIAVSRASEGNSASSAVGAAIALGSVSLFLATLVGGYLWGKANS